MTNMNEKLKCKITVQVTGEIRKSYVNPTRNQLNQILSHLIYCNKSGRDFEQIIIQKDVSII